MMSDDAVPQIIHDTAYQNGLLPLWVIFERPADFPQGYVLRAQFAGPGEVTISSSPWYAATADELRAILPFGVTRMDRMPDDVPSLLEVWI